MYGILSFARDSDGVTDAKAVFADPDNEHSQVVSLAPESRVPSEPSEADNPSDVGVIWGDTDEETGLVEVLCVYYDKATETWWTEKAGEIPIEDAY